MYIQRHLEKEIEKASCYCSVIMVCGQRLNLYYYRDVDKKEIDLLVVEGD